MLEWIRSCSGANLSKKSFSLQKIPSLHASENEVEDLVHWTEAKEYKSITVLLTQHFFCAETIVPSTELFIVVFRECSLYFCCCRALPMKCQCKYMLADRKKSMEYGQINWPRIVTKSKPSPKILPFRSPVFLRGFLELILSTEGQSYEQSNL